MGEKTKGYWLGKTRTQETKEKISISKTGKKLRTKFCDICERNVSLNNFKRHNCYNVLRKIKYCKNEKCINGENNTRKKLLSKHYKWCSEKCWRIDNSFPFYCQNCSKLLLNSESSKNEFFCSNSCSIAFRFKNQNSIKISKSEIEFGNKIEQIFGVKLESSFWIKNKCYDYKVPNKNILIECDGKYWHSSFKKVKNNEYKNKLAKENGYKLYRFILDKERNVKSLIDNNINLFKRILCI